MTLPCSFDGATQITDDEGSISWDFTTSDCFIECQGSGCDGVLLGNGVIDESCALNICGYDGGDKFYCADGCTLEFLQDTIEHSECINQNCFYQNGVNGVNWCQLGCSREDAFDDTCNS